MERTAIVIGGTRRVGRWVSEALCIQGAEVHGIYRSDEAAALSCREGLGSAGYKLDVHQADATDPKELGEVIESIAVKAGRLDVLVNCAGAAAMGPIMKTSPDDLEAIWRGNMLIVHNAVTAAVPYLRPSQGRIINFLSVGADTLRAFRQVPVYAAAKAMLASYSRSLARELAPSQVTVNCLALGISELQAENVPVTEPESLPTGRAVNQEDVAAAIWYLTGPASAQVTGTVINLSGGWAL